MNTGLTVAAIAAAFITGAIYTKPVSVSVPIAAAKSTDYRDVWTPNPPSRDVATKIEAKPTPTAKPVVRKRKPIKAKPRAIVQYYVVVPRCGCS